MAECLLVGRNFVSGICKLKPLKTLKPLKPKNLFSYFFVKQRHRLLPITFYFLLCWKHVFF